MTFFITLLALLAILLVAVGFLILLWPGTAITELNCTLDFRSPKGEPLTHMDVNIYHSPRVTTHYQHFIYSSIEEIQTDDKGRLAFQTNLQHGVTYLEAILLKINRIKKPPFTLAFHSSSFKKNNFIYALLIDTKKSTLQTFAMDANLNYVLHSEVQPEFNVASLMQRTPKGWNLVVTLQEL